MKLKFGLTLFFVLSFFCLSVYAFTTFPKATLKIDRNEISVGDVINAEVDISVPSFALLLQSEDDFFVEGWDIYDFSFIQDVLDEEKYKLKLVLTSYDSKLKEIPKIKLSYINKTDVEKEANVREKFYFFTNSVPVVINGVLDKYGNDTIFDIKKPKRLSVPIIFYLICVVFVLFVLFVVYKNIITVKVQKCLKINFSPREKAVRQLNNICITNLDVSKIGNHYCTLSNVLKKFILDLSGKNDIEFTSSELINMVSSEDNIFYDYRNEISGLFKVYDDAKYSTALLDKDKFINVYVQTESVIEKLNSKKNSLEIR